MTARLARALRLDGNPLSRASDRAEAWVRVGLLVVFLAAGPVAALAAGGSFSHGGAQTGVTARHVHAVQAVLLQSAPTAIGPYAAADESRQVWVTARWDTAGDSARTGAVPVLAGSPAGSVVTVWLDPSGRVTSPPEPGQSASDAAFVAVMALVAVALVLRAALQLMRRFLNRRRLAAWEAAWSAIGPRWTGHRSLRCAAGPSHRPEDAMANAMSAGPSRGADTSARHRRLKAAVQMAAIGAITVAAGFAVYAERATVLRGLKAFRHTDLRWVLAGFAAESLSMVAFALLQRRLLLAAGARLTFGELMAIVYTSTAISLAVPVAGSGLATAYSHRRFRAGSADPAGVGMAMLMAGMISTVAFAVVVGAGGVVSGNPAAALAGVATSLLAAVAMGCLVVVLHSPGGRGRLRRPAVLVLELAQRLVRRPQGDADAIVTGTLERLGAFSLSLPSILAAFGYALVNWAADVLCLAAAIAAIGSPVPWDKLVLAWSAGQAAASFSPTPYGIGIVDVALIIALHAARLRTPDAVAAVLWYRIVTFKFGTTLLWMGYQYLRRS